MPSTRRRLLAAVAALGVGSGCLDAERQPGNEPQDSGWTPGSGRDDDPTVIQPRNPEGNVVVREPDGDGGDQAVRRRMVTDADGAAAIEPVPGVSADDADRIRAFLDETNYDEETVSVRHANPKSCSRYRIHSVSWEASRIEYEYCEERRPPDERCAADERETLGLLFRLPVAFDGDIRGSGASGRSPCRGSPTDYERIEGNATVAGNRTVVPENDDT